jgi:hypothetical protein
MYIYNITAIVIIYAYKFCIKNRLAFAIGTLILFPRIFLFKISNIVSMISKKAQRAVFVFIMLITSRMAVVKRVPHMNKIIIQKSQYNDLLAA